MDVLCYSIIYIALVILVCILIFMFPYHYISEKEQWETVNCICISVDYQSHNISATFYVDFWRDGNTQTNLIGKTPSIVENSPEIIIGNQYSCAIDPESINNQTLIVFPTIWLQSWKVNIITWTVIILFSSAVSLVPILFCIIFPRMGTSSRMYKSISAESILTDVNHNWDNTVSTSMKTESESIDPNLLTMNNAIFRSPSIYKIYCNFIFALQTLPLLENSIPEVENMSKIDNNELRDVVSTFYNHFGVDLWNTVLDTYEKNGITDLIKKKQENIPKPEESDWSLVHSNIQTDRILDSSQKQYSISFMKLSCLISIFILCLLALSMVSGGFIAIVYLNPEDNLLIGSIGFQLFLFGFFCNILYTSFCLSCLFASVFLVLVTLFRGNKSFSNIIFKFFRGYSQTFEIKRTQFFVAFKEIYKVTTTRYNLDITKLYLDDIVWIIKAVPQLPIELKNEELNLFVKREDLPAYLFENSDD